MTDNNAASDKEKVVTKYDRKMQKRKEEARKKLREDLLLNGCVLRFLQV